MDYGELRTSIEEIPREAEGVFENLARLLRHANYLEEPKGISDHFAGSILECAPAFIRKQIQRLVLHQDDDIDVIAWVSRSLMELHFMLCYMALSREAHDEVIQEKFKDLRDIENILYPEGAPAEGDSEEAKDFHVEMQTMWNALREYGIERENLGRPKQGREYAEKAGLIDDFNRLWKFHSKYVHPTSYLIFGKRNLVYGDESRVFFWVCAQLYAARNLRYLHKMIEAVPPNAELP